MPKTILIIDDDASLAEGLKDYLKGFDFQVLVEKSSKNVVRALQESRVDIIVMEAVLPEKDGVQLCREIRRQSDVPVLFLSNRADATDRIVGLEVGADDYMAKPFERRELVARIQAILRRPRFVEKRKTLRFPGLEINLKDHTVLLGSKALDLTTMEFSVLALLASRPGEVFSRDAILDHLRGADYECYSRTVDVLLSRLRSKLKDDPKRPKWIKTVWGSGYAFVGSPTETKEAA